MAKWWCHTGGYGEEGGCFESEGCAWTVRSGWIAGDEGGVRVKILFSLWTRIAASWWCSWETEMEVVWWVSEGDGCLEEILRGSFGSGDRCSSHYPLLNESNSYEPICQQRRPIPVCIISFDNRLCSAIQTSNTRWISANNNWAKVPHHGHLRKHRSSHTHTPSIPAMSQIKYETDQPPPPRGSVISTKRG